MPHQERTASFPGRQRAPSVEELLNSPFAARKLERELKICEAARPILSFCRYRRAPDHRCYVRPASRPSVLGGRRGRSSCAVVDLPHPIRWHEEVYRRGLAHAAGCFVLGVAEDLWDGKLVVLACVQGRGCGLRLRHAVARRGREGWELACKGLPQKYKILPEDSPGTEAEDYYRLAVMRSAAGAVDAALNPGGRQ